MTILKDDMVLARGIDGPCRVINTSLDSSQKLCQLETEDGFSTWREENKLEWLGTPKFETVFIVADNRDTFEPFKTIEAAKHYIGEEVNRFAITRVRVQCGYVK